MENMYSVMFWNEACEALPSVVDENGVGVSYTLFTETLEGAVATMEALADVMYAGGAVEAVIYNPDGSVCECYGLYE